MKIKVMKIEEEEGKIFTDYLVGRWLLADGWNDTDAHEYGILHNCDGDKTEHSDLLRISKDVSNDNSCKRCQTPIPSEIKYLRFMLKKK